MDHHSNHQTHESDHRFGDDAHESVDYPWFKTQFQSLQERLDHLESAVTGMEQHAASSDSSPVQTTVRQYYSVLEFAREVDRGKYTVREWCRLKRIHAEKCDTGRGEDKSWKIPVEELGRYRDHGLLPAKYLR